MLKGRRLPSQSGRRTGKGALRVEGIADHVPVVGYRSPSKLRVEVAARVSRAHAQRLQRSSFSKKPFVSKAKAEVAAPVTIESASSAETMVFMITLLVL